MPNNLPRSDSSIRSATLGPTLWLTLGCFGLAALVTLPAQPGWWGPNGQGAVLPEQVTTNNGVITTNYVPNPYGVVTQGQLKQFTSAAARELNADLSNSGGAGPALSNLVYGWQKDYATNGYATNTANPSRPYKPSDFQVVNVGQLKYVASLVYGQLGQAGYTGLYPSWIVRNTNTDNVAANMGQLKEVFDYDLSVAPVAVTNLTATAVPGGVDLTWSNPVGNPVSSLEVIQTNPNGTTTTNTLAANSTSFAATGLAAGTGYSFTVVALNQKIPGSGSSSSTSPVDPIAPLILSEVSGDDQAVAAGTFEASPLVVQVTNGTGTPLANTPVTFAVATGSDGGLAQTSGGTAAASLSLTTDANGKATIYYQAGTDVLQNNSVMATAVSGAGNVSVTFTAYCGLQSGLSLWMRADEGVTADTNGNVNQWQDQSLGDHLATQSASIHQAQLGTDAVTAKPSLRFNGNQWLSGADSIPANQDITIITVAEADNPANFGIAACLGTNPASGGTVRGVGYRSNQPEFDVYGNSGQAGQALADGVSHVSTTTFTRSTGNVSFYTAGTLTGQSSVSCADLTAGFILGGGGWSSAYWTGTISEVLVYNRVLSSSEQQEAEGYLGDKYGLYDPNATWPLAYSSSVQAEITANQWSKAQADAYVAFLAGNPPVPAAGLQLWFKADSGVTYDANNLVSQWVDQRSGIAVSQGSTNTEPSYVANNLNGLPAVAFNGSARLSSSAYVPLDQDWTIITAGESNDTSSERYMVGIGNIGTALGSRGFGNSNGDYVLGTDNAYLNTGTYLDVGEDNISEAVYVKNTQVLDFYARSVLVGSGTVQTGPTSYGVNLGDISNGNYPRLWNGTIHEVLVYNRALSTAERQQVEGYLADKYGYYNPSATWPLAYSSEVQAQITANQWSKAQADAYVAFLAGNPPVPAEGLRLWFKADDGVSQDGNGNVTSWTDQVANYTVTPTGTGMPTYISGDVNAEPAIRFNGSQYLWSASSVGNTLNAGMTMISVAMTTAPGNLENTAALGNGTAYQSRNQGYYQSNQLFDAAVTYTEGAPAPNASSFVTETTTLDASGSNVTFYRNGVQTGTGTLSGVQSISPQLTIGNRGGDRAAPWVGDIAEVLVYDHPLSSAELTEVDGYLADKYGLYDINATWPSAYPAAVQAEITKHQWNRNQAQNYVAMQANNPAVLTNGLSLWLKADTGVTTNSGQVTAIADQTGNYTLAQTNTSNQPAYIANAVNGKPALQFNGSQYLYAPSNSDPGLNSDMTVITVGMSANPGAQSYSLYLGQASTLGANRSIGYHATELFDTLGSCSGGYAPPSGFFAAETVTLDPTLTDVTFYQNGSQSGTGVLTGIQNVSPGITMGAAAGGSYGWQGEIAEQLVYDHQLSAAELQQVGLYLATKYGLGFYGNPPVISPNGGSYSGTQQVSLTTTIPGSTIHYTLDGTSPTANYTTYTAPFYLSGSSLVSAVVSSSTSGVQLSQIGTAQFYINDPNSTGFPPTPTGLTVASASAGETDLSWTDNGAATYSQIYVYRSTNGGAYELIATLASSATTYADTNVQSGTSYQYKIGSLNSSGESDTAASTAITPATAASLEITVSTPTNATPLP